ncbi:NEDD8 ultimate buster 1-like [Tubulanus polymorphus]|uniref:NEDD8 ultimate buster 1-like n=1 Tax=Tubulanus polymorphus TaxID=672921 RepID=UPI003DA6239A
MDGAHQALRALLNRDKIKLWLMPYSNTDGSKGEEPKDLIENYAKELNLSEGTVLLALEELRKHALEKLAAKNRFQESGVATLRVKFVGCIPEQLKSGLKTGIIIETNLNIRGNEFKNSVSHMSGIAILKMKLISCGKVIDETSTLTEQHIKNNSQVMAICLSESEVEMRQEEEDMFTVQKTKAAAELLSNKKRNEGDPEEEYFMQIADQTGKPINLPPDERKALAVAMTLHEKGKASLRRKEYGLALLLLLEADKEFRKCRSDILNAVDNFAILCLDIVWCYLCLKNISDLPDAESRLKSCEDCFHKSYGVNLERLTVVKGTTGNEQALYMRLHLLQGILAYYQGSLLKARCLLAQAQQELQLLLIDENSLNQVMMMGFSEKNARLGLRACQGNIDAAIQHIIKRREEKKLLREKERVEKEEKKLSHMLGKTANGQWVNSSHYKQIISMGFPKGSAREALRQGNNNLATAIEILQEHPELLSLPDPSPRPAHISENLIQQIVSMGFNPAFAREALSLENANLQRAIDMLIRNGGFLPLQLHSSDSQPGTSEPELTAEQIQKEKDAMDAIVPDIPEDEDSYLDLTLEDEATFLNEYQILLNITS